MDTTDLLIAEKENAQKIEHILNQITEFKKEHESYEKRLTKIETSREKTEFQYEEIIKTLNKLNDTTIPNLIKDINELKNKPVKRYESIVSAFISGIVAIIVSLLF